jgi:outer membrane protein W
MHRRIALILVTLSFGSSQAAKAQTSTSAGSDTVRIRPVVLSVESTSDVAPAIEESQQPPAGRDPATQAGQKVEEEVTRNVRRYHVGVFGGVSVDPELITVGAHANLGPFFTRHITFRPGLELGFGEVTTLLALNLDGVYHITGQTRGKWSPFAGAGANLSVRHLGFEGQQDGNRFDFGNWDWASGINFLVGMETAGGAFFELRATAHSNPHVRLLVGFNF